MISVIGSQSSQAQASSMDPAKMIQQFQQKFEEEFGTEALESIQNEDGTINIEKLEAFLEEQGIEKPATPPPPPDMGMFGAPEGGMDEESLLQKVAEDFGAEAAEDIQNEDGSIDFEKLKELLDSKMQEARDSGADAGYGLLAALTGDETLFGVDA